MCSEKCDHVYVSRRAASALLLWPASMMTFSGLGAATINGTASTIASHMNAPPNRIFARSCATPLTRASFTPGAARAAMVLGLLYKVAF